MIIKRLRCLVILNIMVLLIACSQKEPPLSEDPFFKFISVDEMNTKMEISIPKELNDFIAGEEVDLIVKNKTREKIIFPSDYGVRIFKFAEDRWIEVNNDWGYFPISERTLFPKGKEDPAGLIVVTVNPRIESASEPVKVRIVVVGILYHKDTPTDAQVGAYIDVILQP